MRKLPVVRLALCIGVMCSSCGNYQHVLHRPQITDGISYGRKELPSPACEPYRFATRDTTMDLPALEEWADRKALRKYHSPGDFLEGSNTTALLVVRNDTILFESYYNGYSAEDVTQVFSITKPLTASLLSVALDAGCITSMDTPVHEYMDIKKRKGKSRQLTLRHLGQMQSGINHSDHRRLFRIIRFYHAVDADRYIRKVKVVRTPGRRFCYKSIDTQVLGACLEDAFGEEDLMDRFAALYWHNIGPERKGYYSVDDTASGNIKYYAGLNIAARDLAKIGKLYLDDGRFEGRQVLPPEWIAFINDPVNHVGRFRYCMGWYFDENGPGRDVFYGSGFNGQILAINRDNNTIVIRFGESKSGHEWYRLMCDLSALF